MSDTYRLIVSPRATADLKDILSYIARDNPKRAGLFVAELESKCRLVASAPHAFPGREHLVPGLRMAVHRRYVILFRVLPDEMSVRIERVLHGARDLPRAF